MAIQYICDRCGATSNDPHTDLWVRHLVSKDFSLPVESGNLARRNELCHSCREAYEEWITYRR